MPWAQRIYQGVVDVLPYVVVAFGLFSTALGAYGLYSHYALPEGQVGLVNAALPLAFGLFLTWSGWGTVRRSRRDEPDEDP